jgi:hypothetical protein
MHKAYPDEEYRQKVREFWHKDGEIVGTAREVSAVCKDGKIKEIEFRRTQLADGRAVVMLVGITDRKQAEKKLACRATHDFLTGFPNRMLFNDRLSIALAQAQRLKGTWR